MNINALSSTAPLSKPNNFKYNGFEEQTEFDLGWFDYKARFFDPQIGRFLQVDAAADMMKTYSPYNYAFDNPIRFVDKDGNIPSQATTDPNDLIKGKKIDMNGASKGSPVNSAGFKRNGRFFWKEMVKKHPEMFSNRNRARIKGGVAPYVDSQWIDFNPSHSAYKDGKLIHHHVEEGRFATGVPEKAHIEFDAELHKNNFKGKKNPRTQSARGKGNRASRILKGMRGVLGGILPDISGGLTGDPHSFWRIAGSTSPKEDILYFDGVNDVYFEISNVVTSEDGNSVMFTYTRYESYEWDKEQRRYVGTGRSTSVTMLEERGDNGSSQVTGGTRSGTP